MTADYAASMGAHSVDWDQMIEYLAGLKGNGVLRGMDKTVTGGNLTVTVGAGVAKASGIIRRFGSSTGVDFTGDPDGTNPRKALIVVDSSGSITKRLGTAAPVAPAGKIRRQTYDPDPPEISAGDTVLYEVWLPAAASTISDADVSDRRIDTIPDRRGVWATEFATSGSGTDADPWPIQAIIDELQYIIDEGASSPGKAFLDSGVFRGTTSIAFDTNAKNASNIIVQGSGMGGWESDGFGRYWGRGTTIDYGGTGEAMRFGSAAMANVYRLQLRDFTLKGTSSAASGIELENCYRNTLQNITIYGFSQKLTTTWGVHSKNSFSGRFVGLFFHDNFNGIFLEHTSNNGFQADLGFIEVDGFGDMASANDRYGIKLRGCLAATGFKGLFVVNFVNLGAGNAIGIHLTSCKGISIVSPYVEGGVNISSLTDIGIQVDNSQSVTLTSPAVTKIGTYGLYAFGNATTPVAIHPQFGADSGVDSTGTGIQGTWTIIGEPLFKAEWTGPYGNVVGGGLYSDGGIIAGSVGTFGNGDTTPDVGFEQANRLWRTNNSGATTITQFDNGELGMLLRIRAGDTNTTIQHGTNIFLKDGTNKTLASNETIVLCQFTTDRWDEV